MIVWLLWVYDAITNLAPLRLNVALRHARDVLHLERSLHLDPELSLDRWLAGHHTLGLILSDYYDNAHFIVTLGLLGYLWWRRPDLYRPLRNALVLVNVLAFIVFWRYPVAPPRMLDGFTDVVASTGAFGSWHTGALASQANQLAAMPSLHMAWAAWCALAAVADLDASLGACARGPLPVHDRAGGARHGQPLPARHPGGSADAGGLGADRADRDGLVGRIAPAGRPWSTVPRIIRPAPRTECHKLVTKSVIG